MAGNTIYYSLTDRNRAQPVKNFIGAANYREMFADPLMWLSLRHNCKGTCKVCRRTGGSAWKAPRTIRRPFLAALRDFTTSDQRSVESDMNLLWQFAQNQHCPYDGLCSLEFACLQLNFTNPLWHST